MNRALGDDSVERGLLGLREWAMKHDAGPKAVDALALVTFVALDARLHAFEGNAILLGEQNGRERLAGCQRRIEIVVRSRRRVLAAARGPDVRVERVGPRRDDLRKCVRFRALDMDRIHRKGSGRGTKFSG